MTWRTSHLTAALLFAAGCKGHPEAPPAPAPPPPHAPVDPHAPVKGVLIADVSGSDVVNAGTASGAPPGPTAGSALGSDGSDDGSPVPGQVDTTHVGSGSAVKVHGSTWQTTDPDGGAKFGAFKETWVYVDGQPKGVLLYPEIPQWQPVAWRDDIEGLDFKPGDPPPYDKKVQKLEYRLVDYLKNIGVDPNKVKGLYIHGSGYTFVSHDTLLKYANGITFDFAGNDMTKTRFHWPGDMKVNASFDRYAAVSVMIDKPLLTIDEHSNPFIDGVLIGGVPYHGTPERGGVRVYLDGKLAYVIKRNLLNDTGRLAPTEPRWSLRKLLEASGVKTDQIAAVDVVDERDVYHQTRERMPDTILADLDFASESSASGEIVLGKEAKHANAILLYSKGHVPKPAPLPPLKRDWQKGS